MPEVYSDVLVIGGGPAGSATATLLARLGYTVTLLERSHFPKDKVCGDYLTPGAIAILRDSLGLLPELRGAGAAEITCERIVGHNGQDFSGTTAAFCCPRAITDAVLILEARRAGVTILEGTTIQNILIDGDRVIGAVGNNRAGDQVRYLSSITVGADGTHSLLARQLGYVRPIPRLSRLALSAYFHVPQDVSDAITMTLPQDRSDACCGVGAASGPNDVRNVTMVVPKSEASRIAARKQDYFTERLQTSFPDVWETLRTGQRVGSVRTIGCFGHWTTRASHDGAVLVGDAATFINPFTGEGVFFALRGAELAAEAIHTALSAGDPSRAVLQRYDRARRHELLPRYHLCDIVQRIVHSPPMLSWCGDRLRRSQTLTDSVLKTIGDVAKPHELLSVRTLKQALVTM